MAEKHIYRLSSIDQSLLPTYIRCCLCFPCEDAKIAETIGSLLTAVKRAVTHIPILAGTVQPIDGDDQHGRLEVSVTLDQVKNFTPIVKHYYSKSHIPTYGDLSAAEMPPMALMGDDFTPLPDNPSPENSPVFAIQANFIRGGTIIALCLHHSVADIHGLAKVLQEMSSDLPSRKLCDDDLRQEALERSRLRDRLSGSRGVKADPATHAQYGSMVTEKVSQASSAPRHGSSRVLGFDLGLVEGTKDMINERFHGFHEGRAVQLSGFDCIAAILWKAVNRAIWSQGALYEGPQATLVIPVNVRNSIEPLLDEDFFGNASIDATTHSAIVRLGMPFELTSIQHTASLIRASTASVNENYVRSAIAAINQGGNVIENKTQSHKLDTNLVITSWADLPFEEAHLGLGLGGPQWGRKLGRTPSAFGCILLPVKQEQGVWEVTVEFTDEVMERLLEDEGLMKFVQWVA